MIVVALDLSSKCIGVTVAQLEHAGIKYAKTFVVIPEKLNAKNLGFTTKKSGELGYRKVNEFHITQKEKLKRNRLFKHSSHIFLLTNIGHQLGNFLLQVKPDVLAIERNKSFKGILTTKLLAEIAGGLYFWAGAFEIKMYDWDESEIRARIRRDIPEVDLTHPQSKKMALDTKWEIQCRLRKYFTDNHPGIFDFSNMTLDESDSLAVFYYLYKEVIS
jgi:hypothetical protein